MRGVGRKEDVVVYDCATVTPIINNPVNE